MRDIWEVSVFIKTPEDQKLFDVEKALDGEEICTCNLCRRRRQEIHERAEKLQKVEEALDGKITMYDPPSGWRYGFPKPYRPHPGESLDDTLRRDGYPIELLTKGLYCTFWDRVQK